MNTAHLQPGDVVEARVQGKAFQARVVGPGEGLAVGTVKVEPVEDWPTWRFLRPRQIVRKVATKELSRASRTKPQSERKTYA